jgi:hypothetical protein
MEQLPHIVQDDEARLSGKPLPQYARTRADVFNARGPAELHGQFRLERFDSRLLANGDPEDAVRKRSADLAIMRETHSQHRLAKPALAVDAHVGASGRHADNGRIAKHGSREHVVLVGTGKVVRREGWDPVKGADAVGHRQHRPG